MAAALAGEGLELVFDGPETQLLIELDRAVAGLAPGVLVTWNGSGFDLPFLADRARLGGVSLGLRLRPDPFLRGRADPLPGHECGYRASWHQHRHLDGYRLYRGDVGAIGMSCGLKPLARYVGLAVVEVDREAIHELSAGTRRCYVASDARLARALVLRRAATAVGAVDPWVGAQSMG
ncbi:MAG: hypothetical protein ACE5GB_02405 [Acidimicrobiales bacterium]